MAEIVPIRSHWVVAPEQAAADFIAGYKATTARSYAPQLRRWLHFCRDSHLDPWGVSRVHIEAYLRRMPASSAQGAATVICGYYSWAHLNGLTKTDLGWGVRRPRVGRHRAGTYATREELAHMLTIAREDSGDTWGLLSTLILMGTRIGETLALTVDDVERTREGLRITLYRKPNHTDVLDAPDGVVQALTPLLDARHTGRLLRWHGRPMSYEDARVIVEAIAERAGCEQHITPHSLRRSFVTLARDLGVDDEDIMAMTGHVDVTMIEYYDRGRRQRDATAARAVEDALRDAK